ncbi:protein SCO1/2 [Leeuwenhoekiella aestuarii]|uniref:Protein SCO1/2 n=1 Tax=Leeuwenhoekiella aestuarii TaxID=2249426 RepID=A0A4Q0NSX3_9FLAO|nr:SCO family protein [Leeuwenhoekiella aestuarii]RXG14102.1 protein SCO1/2 [Leeuwenhoekiella aestuarii]RXG18851.1 protein SCO1/2 [Leeuwenhoekiella aestuarii]
MNKKKTYIGIAVIVLIFGVIVIPKIIDRLMNDEVVKNDRLNVANLDTVENEDALSYININGKDRKVPHFEFVNQDGDTIAEDFYKGKVFLVEFFFTRCPTICIPMNKNLVLIQNKFKDNPDFGIASFSIDPEHDTPKVLKEYTESYGITDPDWNLMTGDREKIYELANVGFNLLAQENPNIEGNFQHSGLFALVDQNGFIRSRKDEFGNPLIYYRGFIPQGAPEVEGEETSQIDILIEDINKLLNKNN